MRVVEFIKVRHIQVNKLSVSEQTFDLAKKLDNKTILPKDLPPVKLVKEGGKFILKDGRHRITAFKLAGIKEIKGKYYDRK